MCNFEVKFACFMIKIEVGEYDNLLFTGIGSS